MLQKLKDIALSKGIKLAINSQIEEYGNMLRFELDSKLKSIDLEVLLDGEKEPLSVKIEHYEIFEVDNNHYISAKKVVTSRAWINTIIASHLKDKKVEIPSQHVALVKTLI